MNHLQRMKKKECFSYIRSAQLQRHYDNAKQIKRILQGALFSRPKVARAKGISSLSLHDETVIAITRTISSKMWIWVLPVTPMGVFFRLHGGKIIWKEEMNYCCWFTLVTIGICLLIDLSLMHVTKWHDMAWFDINFHGNVVFVLGCDAKLVSLSRWLS